MFKFVVGFLILALLGTLVEGREFLGSDEEQNSVSFRIILGGGK